METAGRKTGHKIIFLPKEKWKGTVIPMVVSSGEYFDVEISETENDFNVRMIKKPFARAVTHTPDEYDFPDKLYQDHWPDAEAWGIVGDDGALLACIEVCPESWSNRLAVTELWVAQPLRNQGAGTALMDKAKQIARERGCRAIMLETQSCNTAAIAFYRKQGFRLIGFDTCCYTNQDIQRHEVRLNLGFLLDDRATRF